MNTLAQVHEARVQRLFEADEDVPKGVRSPSQVDRDRILYSTAFRRLAEVTQVVQAAEGHLFHNRLTHVLKVAQIGRRTVERLLGQEGGPERGRALGGLDPDVVEAAGLAHDLGHPPFGHIAEDELSRLAKNLAGTDEGFEGNAQSFRIVTKLAMGSKEQGLNLTRATLNAILKYPWNKQETGKRSVKWGFYDEEAQDFEAVRKAALYRNSKTLEAEIMDWSDDVAYAIYDMDDFYRAGLVPLDRLIDGSSRELNRFFDNVSARWIKDDRHERNLDDHRTQFEDGLLKILRETREVLRDPYGGGRAQRTALRGLTSMLVRRYSEAIQLADPAKVVGQPKTEDDLETGPQLVTIEKEKKMEVEILKQLAWCYVIEHPALAAQQEGQKNIIHTLFQRYTQAAEKGNWNIFPAGLRSDLQGNYKKLRSKPVLRARIVIDLISNMTETQAIQMYNRLTGYSAGSMKDRIIA